MTSKYMQLLEDPGFVKSLGIDSAENIHADDGVDDAAFLERFQQNVAAVVSISIGNPSK